MKEVTEEEFDKFVKEYKGQLYGSTSQVPAPSQYIVFDETLGEFINERTVAKIILHEEYGNQNTYHIKE